MNLIEAIILGVIQGATEFLPISSSAHLVLVPDLLHLTAPSLSLIAIVHEGTLLAVFLYFRRDLWQIAKGMLAGLQTRQPLSAPASRLGWYIIGGSIPAAVAGLALEGFFEKVFGTPRTAAFFLFGTAALLIIGERLLSGEKSIERMSWLDVIVIGLAQMLALFPGISRSGSTIAAALWRGLDRPAAARYSFLLGVPAIFGAGLLAAIDLVTAGDFLYQWPMMAASFAAAAVSGFLCIHFLLSWLRRRTLYVFAFYCVAFASLFLLFSLAP